MKIAVDMDGVVVDLETCVFDALGREYGVRPQHQDVKDFHDLGRIVEEVTGIPGGLFGWLSRRDWLWAKAPAITGAIGGLMCLRDSGHRIELLTSKPDWAEWTVWTWAGKWRPPVHSVSIAPMGVPKHELTDAMLLVDDGLHNIAAWDYEGRPAILFDQPWNQQLPQAPGKVLRRTFRAKGWPEVVRIVKGMSE